MWPYSFACPFVGAIIEREVDGHKQLLIQTRDNVRDPRYKGVIEFPGGVLDANFEPVLTALKREVEEETGLVVSEIIAGSEGPTTTTGRDDLTMGFQPFYCLQQLRGDYPWVGFVFVCHVEVGEPQAQADETKQPRWIDHDDLRAIVEQQPEQIFGLQLPAWQHYFSQR